MTGLGKNELPSGVTLEQLLRGILQELWRIKRTEAGKRKAQRVRRSGKAEAAEDDDADDDNDESDDESSTSVALTTASTSSSASPPVKPLKAGWLPEGFLSSLWLGPLAKPGQRVREWCPPLSSRPGGKMPDTKPALSRAQLKQQADAANRHLHDASGSSSVAEAVAKAVRNEFRTDFQGFQEDKQLARVELEAKLRKQQFEELQCLVTLAETAEEANDARSRLKQLICSPMPSLQNSIPTLKSNLPGDSFLSFKSASVASSLSEACAASDNVTPPMNVDTRVLPVRPLPFFQQTASQPLHSSTTTESLQGRKVAGMLPAQGPSSPTHNFESSQHSLSSSPAMSASGALTAVTAIHAHVAQQNEDHFSTEISASAKKGNSKKAAARTPPPKRNRKRAKVDDSVSAHQYERF